MRREKKWSTQRESSWSKGDKIHSSSFITFIVKVKMVQGRGEGGTVCGAVVTERGGEGLNKLIHQKRG